MKNNLHFNQFIKALVLSALIILSFKVNAQMPNPALVGYWHNWNDGSAPYIILDSIDSRYNVIEVSFATPVTGTDYNMTFVPEVVSIADFQSGVSHLQTQGRKVLLSIGGANGVVKLDNVAERDTFVTTMTNIITYFNFDGIDLDLESGSVIVTGGTISNPTDQSIINMIAAVKQIMSNYRTHFNKKMLLTMAPETALVQGGMSAYGSIWGAYLPIIDGLRDSLDILQVQLYNSGTMNGIDGISYTSGTADFIVAMTEAVIHGFTATTGGQFNGLPASKVAVGLPACTSAAGSGFTDTATVKHAIDYLRGTGTKPGSYTLAVAGGYPDLRGMMTWSINWDKVATCGSVYEFATNFQRIFHSSPSSIVESSKSNLSIYPNPANNLINIDLNKISKVKELTIYNDKSQVVMTPDLNSKSIDVSKLSAGLYVIHIITDNLIINKKISILH